MHALKHTARFVLCCLALPAVAESYSYQAISQRHSGAQLNGVKRRENAGRVSGWLEAT